MDSDYEEDFSNYQEDEDFPNPQEEEEESDIEDEEFSDKIRVVKSEINDVNRLITNEQRKFNFGPSIGTLGELHSKLKSQQDLLEQLKENKSQVKELNKRYNDEKKAEEEGALMVATQVIHSGQHFRTREESVGRILFQQQFGREATLITPTPPSSSKKDFLCCAIPPGGNIFENVPLLENSEDSRGEELIKISFQLCDTYEPHPERRLGTRMMLSEFGTHVRKLVLEDDKDLNGLTSCLGQSGHCPKLQILHLTILKEISKEEISIRNLGTLKLKEFHLFYSAESISNSKSRKYLLTVFDTILKKSPEIEHLKIHPTLFISIDWKTGEFLKALKSRNMKHLKTLEVLGQIVENFETLSSIKFGPNFTKIVLQDILFQSTDAEVLQSKVEKEQKSFSAFLKEVSVSLEVLRLSGAFLNNWIVSVCKIPKMMKLKELHYYGGPPQPFILDFLTKFPFLKRLSLGEYQSYEKLLGDYRSECSQNGLPRLIHKNLEHIQLLDKPFPEIGKIDTIWNLRVAFPNLERLEFAPNPDPVEKQLNWFQDVFGHISNMKNLKELKIRFFEWKCDRVGVNLYKAFKKLRDTPNLVELSLEFSEEKENDWIGTSLMGLRKAPNLRRLRISWDEAVKKEPMFTQAIDKLATKNIQIIWE